MTRAPVVRGVTARLDGRPFVVVHGGSEAERYRNVLEALETALALGADYFEFDVRKTADGVLVVHHDEVIGPTVLRAAAFADAHRAAAANGYELPRLERVLSRARGSIRLDVELKETGSEASIIEQLGAHGFDRDHFVMTSFEQPALDAVHALDPEVVTGLLVYDMSGEQALQCFHASGARFLGPDHAILDETTLRAAARAGVPLMAWTVNDPAVLHRLLRSEAVLGVITDDPRATLAAMNGERPQ